MHDNAYIYHNNVIFTIAIDGLSPQMQIPERYPVIMVSYKLIIKAGPSKTKFTTVIAIEEEPLV